MTRARIRLCPEVESGLDAPRESMRLVQADGRIRLLTNKTAQDHTTRMQSYARRRVEELADSELCCCLSKQKGGSTIRGCARTSSSASLPTGRPQLRAGLQAGSDAERDAAARRLRRELLRRERLAVARRVAAQWLDSPPGSTRVVPVVLPLLHGPQDR